MYACSDVPATASAEWLHVLAGHSFIVLYTVNGHLDDISTNGARLSVGAAATVLQAASQGPR